MKHSIAILFISLLAGVQCQSQVQIDKCQQNNEKSAMYILEYQMTEDIVYLDSALYCINEVFGTCDIDCGLSIRKVGIYSSKRDFQKAIDFIDSLDSKLYYKDLMSYRMKAMKAQYEGDTILRNKYINSIVLDVGDYMQQHKNEIDSLMTLPNLQIILETLHSIVLIQYYYYKAQLEGINNVKLQIDSLQRVVNGNEEYFEMIKQGLNDDFMHFAGF